MLNFLTQPLPRGQWQRSPIKETQEWKEVLEVLRRELRPHEYVSVEFPDGHPVYKDIKYPMTALWHQLKREIHARALPYDVVTRGKIVYVVGRSDLS